MAEKVLAFHLWKTKAAQPYHWTLNSFTNGQVICTSENYVRKEDAMASMRLVYGNAGDARWTDHTDEE